MPIDLYELDEHEWEILAISTPHIAYFESEDETLQGDELASALKAAFCSTLANEADLVIPAEPTSFLNPAVSVLVEDSQLLLDQTQHTASEAQPVHDFDYDREADRAAVIDFIRATEFPLGADIDYSNDLPFDILTDSEAESELTNTVAAQEEETDPDMPIRNFVSLGQTPPPVALLRAQKQQMRRALAIREGNNFKGQYAHKTSLARVSIAKEGPLNKLARYYMQGGHQAKAQGQVLEVLANLYDIMLSRPNHELILRLGGYSPVVGHLIYATLMHNPNTLLGWAGRQYAQTYAFKCFNTTKQVRKRTRVKRGLQCVHVPQAARQSQSLRMLHFFTEDQKYHKVEERMFAAMLDMIFKYKKGILYSFKLKAYRSAFQRARQRQV